VGSELLAYFTRRRGVTSQIGVYATPEGVAAAQVTPRATGKPRLEQCAYEKDVSDDAFERVLGRLPSRRAPTVSVLNPAGYRLLLVEAPDVPADELRAAVRWRVKDLIDFHIDDAVIDVFEMPRHARGGPHRMMYAVTAKADVVKREIERIEGAGLKLDVVDIPELSLRNIATLLESEQRGAALLYLSERRSTLLLVRQGVLYLTRYIETGVATLAEADFFVLNYEQSSIQQVHVSGLEAADRETIARDLSLAVREVDLATLFETDDALPQDLQRLCMPAIGAALRKDPVTL
jgi:MSHA biogenesis protein MshI